MIRRYSLIGSLALAVASCSPVTRADPDPMLEGALANQTAAAILMNEDGTMSRLERVQVQVADTSHSLRYHLRVSDAYGLTHHIPVEIHTVVSLRTTQGSVRGLSSRKQLYFPQTLGMPYEQGISHAEQLARRILTAAKEEGFCKRDYAEHGVASACMR